MPGRSGSERRPVWRPDASQIPTDCQRTGTALSSRNRNRVPERIRTGQTGRQVREIGGRFGMPSGVPGQKDRVRPVGHAMARSSQPSCSRPRSRWAVPLDAASCALVGTAGGRALSGRSSRVRSRSVHRSQVLFAIAVHVHPGQFLATVIGVADDHTGSAPAARPRGNSQSGPPLPPTNVVVPYGPRPTSRSLVRSVRMAVVPVETVFRVGAGVQEDAVCQLTQPPRPDRAVVTVMSPQSTCW